MTLISQMNPENTLDNVVTWNKSWLSGKSAKELCLEEIKKFIKTS